MKHTLAYAALSAALLFTGCSTQRFSTTQVYPDRKATVQETQDFWFWGLNQRKEFDAAAACGSAAKVADVSMSEQPMNIVFKVLTFGIYSPRTISVICKE